MPTHGCSAGRIGSSVATNGGTLQRVENRVITESGQRYRENEQDTDRRDRKPTAVEGRRATLPEELVGQHATWNLHVRSLRGSRRLRATEAWTDCLRAEDDKHVELDYELAVALAIATEGAARSTALKVTQVEPSRWFVAWQALVEGYAPKSSKCPSNSAATHTCDA